MPIVAIPGYREAVAAEAMARATAFLGIAAPICGVEVKPYTPRHAIYLETLGNAFVAGGTPDAADVAQFLWVLSPEFCHNPTAARSFARRVRKIPFISAVRSIEQFLDDCHADSPPSDPSAGRSQPTSWPAALVDIFAREYGWPPETTLDTPFTVLWQLHRRVILARNPKATMFNRSDKVRSAWLSANLTPPPQP